MFKALWVYVAKTHELKVRARKGEYSHLSTSAVKCECISVSVYLLYTHHNSVYKENMVNPVVSPPKGGTMSSMLFACWFVC